LARVREKSGLTKRSNFGVGSIFENINHRNLFVAGGHRRCHDSQ
jgi:hypothetical protein